MHKLPRPQHTDDFKSQAVALSDGVGRTTAARQLGISVKTLENWVAAARSGQPLTSPKRQAVSDLEEELTRLQAENATLKMEREILKKLRRSLPGNPGEVRLRRPSADLLPGRTAVPDPGSLRFGVL